MPTPLKAGQVRRGTREGHSTTFLVLMACDPAFDNDSGFLVSKILILLKDDPTDAAQPGDEAFAFHDGAMGEASEVLLEP